MREHMRYLLFGAGMAGIAIGLPVIVSVFIGGSWVALSMFLLVVFILLTLTRTASSTPGGPTVRPAQMLGGGWWTIQRHMTLKELKNIDHMYSEHEHRDRHHLPPEQRRTLMVWLLVVAFVLVLLSILW